MVILAGNQGDIASLIENSEMVFIVFVDNDAERTPFLGHFADCAIRCKTIVFAKANVEAQAELKQEFAINSLPQLMIFKQDVLIYCESGSVPKATLLTLVDQVKHFDVRKIKNPNLP